MFEFILGTMIVTWQLWPVDYYQLVNKIGLSNSLWFLILPAIANAGTVVDNALLESARIDGSSGSRIFNRTVFPIVMPAIATISILNFVFYWNNLIMPLILLNTKDKFPLPVLIDT